MLFGIDLGNVARHLPAKITGEGLLFAEAELARPNVLNGCRHLHHVRANEKAPMQLTASKVTIFEEPKLDDVNVQPVDLHRPILLALFGLRRDTFVNRVHAR